jgi:hypothetical protein
MAVLGAMNFCVAADFSTLRVKCGLMGVTSKGWIL